MEETKNNNKKKKNAILIFFNWVVEIMGYMNLTHHLHFSFGILGIKSKFRFAIQFKVYFYANLPRNMYN